MPKNQILSNYLSFPKDYKARMGSQLIKKTDIETLQL